MVITEREALSLARAYINGLRLGDRYNIEYAETRRIGLPPPYRAGYLVYVMIKGDKIFPLELRMTLQGKLTSETRSQFTREKILTFMEET